MSHSDGLKGKKKKNVKGLFVFNLTTLSNNIDKRNHQLKFKIWDVNKQFETDPKVMGSNLVISILFFIDNNVTNYICYLLVIYYHCWDKNNPK